MNTTKRKLTIADVRRLHTDAGYHFFDRSTMRVWRTRVESSLLKGDYFITSDSDFNGGRIFNVRRFDRRTNQIKTIESHLKTLAGARAHVKEHQKNDERKEQ